jgi:hypothetical protein
MRNTLLPVLLLSIACVTANARTSLADAQSAIETNLKSPEGKKFDELVGREFVQSHTTALRQCRASSGGDNTNFWLLLKLDRIGSVQEVLLHPETKLGLCARDAYLNEKFPEPPHPDYWVGVYLQLSH